MIASSAHLTGVFFALASALVWGGGDFCGGMAARRSHAYQVLYLSSLIGLAALVILALLRGESLPSLTSAAWAAAAGVSGAVGIATLYRGLSLGNVALVSPVAAVIGASTPALVGFLLQGIPQGEQLAGFAVGFCGIWLVSRASVAGQSEKRRGLGLALAAGLGFGGFFICIAQVEAGTIFAPLVISKVVAVVMALLALRRFRLEVPAIASNLLALLAGLLDAGGNIFYLLAESYTRMDVAVVLASMYPAGTVLLARLVLRERISGVQWLGVGLCVAAVALIAR